MRERREGETCSHITGPGNEPLCKPASQPGGAEHRVGGGGRGQDGGSFCCQEIARTAQRQAQLCCPCATMPLGSMEETRMWKLTTSF